MNNVRYQNDKTPTDLLIEWMEEFSQAEAVFCLFAFIDEEAGLVIRTNGGRAAALGVATAAQLSLAQGYLKV